MNFAIFRQNFDEILPRLFTHFPSVFQCFRFVSISFRTFGFFVLAPCAGAGRLAPRGRVGRGGATGPLGRVVGVTPPVVMPRIEPSHGCFAAFSRVVGTALLVVEFLGRACCLGFRSSALLGPRLRLGPSTTLSSIFGCPAFLAGLAQWFWQDLPFTQAVTSCWQAEF